MIDLRIDEHAEIPCRLCGNSLRAVRISQTGSLPLDVVDFFSNRHRASHPSIIIDGGDWVMTENCPVEHTGEPLLPDRGLPAAVPVSGEPDPCFDDSPDGDREVLNKLFESTDGKGWKDKRGWSTDSGLKDRFGVRVSRVDGRVTRLILENNGLYGNLPGELGRLTKLAHLNLSQNKLGGEIPKELGSLANLRFLSLRGNRLRGRIPPELGALGELTRLFLDGNLLEGEVPGELSSLGKLKDIKLGGNDFTGELPAALRAPATGTFLSGT